MANGHFLRNAVLAVGALVVIGLLAGWLVSALLHVIFYIVVGALVVGGVMYLYGKAKRSVRGGGRRSIKRG
ncbi:hypothetical protein GCM10023322_17840 [Rugosimonospora acidiphila]|uniref:Uncharacterized protein n=1 Tax=Rugosimonospora acidiphila TaxID=556531 RepID=A0ABP9RN34_9ACTN